MADFDFDLIEGNYSVNVDKVKQKKLGQFFTPPHIAKFMSEWVLNNPSENLTILDPAAGLGIFERVINTISNKSVNFDLWELDNEIIKDLKSILKQENINNKLLVGDFLNSSWDKKYDGIISNPPYYKHHYIPNKLDLVEKYKSKTEYKFSAQTNIYCWFLIKCLNQLKSGGRLAFILPSEFLNSNYGEKVKEYFINSELSIKLLNIDYKISVFDKALTTSLIILAEKSSNPQNTISFFSVSCDKQLDIDFLNNGSSLKRNKEDLDNFVKWKNYFKINKTDTYKNLVRLHNFGKFSRGIATGANKYFTLSQNEVNNRDLPKKCLIPVVSKSNQVNSPFFNNEDYQILKNNDNRIYLFNGKATVNKSVKDYIKLGEQNNIHKRYLTKNRDPWYSLENREVSKMWITVFSRDGIKLIWNKTNCVTLTCFHNFFPTIYGQNIQKVIFVYLHTELAFELLEREKREYGDGLDKFEPGDISKAKVLDFTILTENEITEIESIHKKMEKLNTIDQTLVDRAESIFRSYI